MLKFFVIFSICVTTIYASSGNQCFECNGHPEIPHYARNPRGCSWFFVCNPGQAAIANRCPAPYLYNHEKQQCDFADNVDCVDESPLTVCPERGIARIAHPDACSKFICEFFCCGFFEVSLISLSQNFF